MGSKERFFTNITAAHEGVTGSCISFETKFPNKEKNCFATDCGIYQETEYSRFNDILPYNPELIDCFFITHGHADHIARLPFEVRNGFDKPIYVTDITCEFMKPALMDSAKILRETSKSSGKKALYNEKDVFNTLQLCKPCLFEQTYQIDRYTRVTFFKNGHLLGASLILVQMSYPGFDNINILFTGDYNCQNTFFDVPELPERVLNLPLTVIQEATYGDMDSHMVEKKFRANVQKAIVEEKTVVALVFSWGRSQEILYELKTMQDVGELEPEIPIFFDGKLAQKYTYMYENCELGIKEEMKQFLPKNVSFVCKFNRAKVLKDKKQKIIVTTSGMGNHGPAQLYLPEYVQRSDSLIHFTGYTAEGTSGRALKDAEVGEAVQIGGIVVKKRAEVEYTLEYSAHSKADEMINFLKKFRKLNLVLINHGEKNKKEIFAKRVLNEVMPKQVGILGRDYLFRINPYGLVKTVPRCN